MFVGEWRLQGIDIRWVSSLAFVLQTAFGFRAPTPAESQTAICPFPHRVSVQAEVQETPRTSPHTVGRRAGRQGLPAGCTSPPLPPRCGRDRGAPGEQPFAPEAWARRRCRTLGFLGQNSGSGSPPPGARKLPLGETNGSVLRAAQGARGQVLGQQGDGCGRPGTEGGGVLDRSTKVPPAEATKTVPETASAPESAAPKCSQVGRSEGGLNFSLLQMSPCLGSERTAPRHLSRQGDWTFPDWREI